MNKVDFAPHDMTSNVLPEPYVVTISSTLYALTLDGYFAFGGTTSVGSWASVGHAHEWLQLDIGSGNKKYLYSYALTVYGPDQGPRGWTMLGSNTGAFGGEEDILDTQTDILNPGWGETDEYICDVYDTAYRYFRIDITDFNSGDLASIDELYLYEDTDAVWSLTINGVTASAVDGVAYSAVDGVAV